jgi:DNA polymerase III subunit alpha
MYQGDYVHLHCHSQYSLMDGLCSPAELLAAAKDLGHHALAVTDHGTLSAHREMQIAAKEAGLKPILGVEAYISETDRFDRRAVKNRDDNTSVFNHIILLAKNQDGVQNLNRMSEVAWTEGFYRKPRIDLEILDQYGDGIIVLSGCMNGLISKAIEREDPEKADRITRWFKDRFDGDFYMEVQPHNPPELNSQLMDLADLYSIKPVVTNDCHFATEDQRALEEALLIMSTKPKMAPGTSYAESKKIKDVFERLNYLYPDRPISFEKIDVYVQSRQDAAKVLAEQGITRDDVFENTLEIADKVGDYEFHEGLSLLPQPKVDASERLTSMCNAALKKRGLDKDEKYVERLQIELDVIKNKDFSAYFLIEADMIKWAKSKDILVGPGRGSAAGSLVCYLLGITQVDPLKYGLLFARFINEERNDFPDIDTDFQDTRRGEVKEYLHRKFKNVASIATYSYFRDKGVVRDAARVFAVPLGEVNKALKKVEDFEDFESSPNTLEFRNAYPEVLEYARKLRGRIRGTGAHAAGLVVAKENISNFTPLETRSDPKNPVSGRTIVTAYDMDQVADIGLIKYDLLGLKTLSVIKDTLDAIKERRDKEIDLAEINLDDPKVHAMLTAGFTRGVFQVEAVPYTNLIMKMGTEKFDHLAASNALVRPGAMNTVGASFVARKDGREQVKYDHPILEEITKETYGVIIYQEQVMQACVKLAGMSWAEADKIRKIIGKKKDVREFDEYRERFVEGASEHVTREVAEKLWHDFEAHAGYSFNKSHAVAYSMLSFWTAWLKYYYPNEFMYAVLKNEGDADSRTDYLIEAKRLGIKILLPHVNKSQADFTLEGKAIRFGLGDIKSISPEKGAPRIIAGAPYKSYAHLLEYAGAKGSGINSRMIDSLNAIGAAVFDDNPPTGDESSNLYEYLNIPKFSTGGLPPSIMSQITKLEDYEEQGCFIHIAMVKSIKRGTGWSRVELVDESGTIGLFHAEQTTIEPGQMYLILAAENRISRFIPIDELDERSDDALIRFLKADEIKVPDNKRVVLAFNALKTKAGKSYAHVVVANNKKEMERVIAFTKNYPKALSNCKTGAVVQLSLAPLDDGGHYIKDIIT